MWENGVEASEMLRKTFTISRESIKLHVRLLSTWKPFLTCNLNNTSLTTSEQNWMSYWEIKVIIGLHPDYKLGGVTTWCAPIGWNLYHVGFIRYRKRSKLWIWFLLSTAISWAARVCEDQPVPMGPYGGLWGPASGASPTIVPSIYNLKSIGLEW